MGDKRERELDKKRGREKQRETQRDTDRQTEETDRQTQRTGSGTWTSTPESPLPETARSSLLNLLKHCHVFKSLRLQGSFPLNYHISLPIPLSFPFLKEIAICCT